MVAGGATLIQIREKGADVRSFMDDAAAAVRYARECGVRVIVNDRVDLAMVLEADGVHLGQDDLPPAEARRLLGPDAIIGYSTHTVAQARKATELPIDYLAFGPVFPTLTKERPDAVVGTGVLSEIAELAGKLPLVAIGGINEINLEQTLSSGASSAAIISGLLSHPDRIEETLRRMLSRHGKWTNTV